MSQRPFRVAAAILLGVALGACGGGGDDDAAPPEGLEVERIGPYQHIVGDLDYDRPAPSGGDHGPYLVTCGVYEGQVPDELVVHSLEHGAVWIALGPESTDEDREAAADLAEGKKVVVSDVPDLPDPVQLVAWGLRLPLESATDPRAETFIDQFVDAAGAPEAGSTCFDRGEPPTPPVLPTA